MHLSEEFMDEAFCEAQKAFRKDEIPIGAVVVADNQIVGRGHNLVESIQDPAAHAEMLAITAAANSLASWRLNECTLYVTVEPCPMCAGAILLSRISKVVFGAFDPRLGACGSAFSILPTRVLNTRIEVVGGICEADCTALLQSFFEKIRQKKK